MQLFLQLQGFFIKNLPGGDCDPMLHPRLGHSIMIMETFTLSNMMFHGASITPLPCGTNRLPQPLCTPLSTAKHGHSTALFFCVVCA